MGPGQRVEHVTHVATVTTHPGGASSHTPPFESPCEG